MDSVYIPSTNELNVFKHMVSVFEKLKILKKGDKVFFVLDYITPGLTATYKI